MAATIACSSQALLRRSSQLEFHPHSIEERLLLKAYPFTPKPIDSVNLLHQWHNFMVCKRVAVSLVENRHRRGRPLLKTFAGPTVLACKDDIQSAKELAILWFKHDLRLDDHPGVAAALKYQQVLPVYVFDPYVCAGWSKELLESLFDAIEDLRKELRLLGSELVVLNGRTADLLYPLAVKIGATSIITEEEIESGWQSTVDTVLKSLPKASSACSISGLRQWRGSLYDIQEVASIPNNYKDFQRMGFRILDPIEAPTSFPGLPVDTNSGCLPGFDQFSDSVNDIRGENPWWETLISAQEQAAESLVPQRNSTSKNLSGSTGKHSPFKSILEWRDKYILESPQASLLKKQGILKEEEVIGKYFIKGGATGASNVLDGYLRFLEPTSRDDWKAVYEHIWEMEKNPGSSFRTLFGSSLALGTLSRRRIFYEAVKYEKDRNGGRLSPFGFSTFTVAAAVGDVKAMEWFDLLQKNSEVQANSRGFKVGAWRWRGYHIQYSSMGNEGPAVLLVHGFGAFWEHYRDNLRGLPEKGYRVWALTLIGFGRSEKPNVTYTELLWAELVRDFIVEVVQEPVALAGNSIGGYTTTIVAGLWPTLVTSLVLLNTAGKVIPDYKSLTYNQHSQNLEIMNCLKAAGIDELDSRTCAAKKKFCCSEAGVAVTLVLLANLERQAADQQTSRVDDWLLAEVKRGSYDPGNTTVLESIFLLKAPLPLNFYIDRYEGNVLMIQGKHDPLQKNAKRPVMLQSLCSNVTVRYLDAGHCPHDELPDEVNNLIDEFVKQGPEVANQVIATPPTAISYADEAPATAADIVREETKLVIQDLLSSPVKKNK